MLYLLTLLEFGSVCGVGPDLVGIHSIILAARYRAAACSTTLGQGLEKIQTAREHNSTPIFALSLVWERVLCTFHGPSHRERFRCCLSLGP